MYKNSLFFSPTGCSHFSKAEGWGHSVAGQAQIPVPPLSRNACPGHQPFGQVFSCSKGKYLQIHKLKSIYGTDSAISVYSPSGAAVRKRLRSPLCSHTLFLSQTCKRWYLPYSRSLILGFGTGSTCCHQELLEADSLHSHFSPCESSHCFNKNTQFTCQQYFPLFPLFCPFPSCKAAHEFKCILT